MTKEENEQEPTSGNENNSSHSSVQREKNSQQADLSNLQCLQLSFLWLTNMSNLQKSKIENSGKREEGNEEFITKNLPCPC